MDAKLYALSDQFTREYDVKGYTVPKEHKIIKDTYIYDQGLPSVAISTRQQNKIEQNLNSLDSRFDSVYGVDQRILEIGKAADADYQRRKQILNQLQDEKLRQQRYFESLERIKQQKELLDTTARFENEHDYNTSNYHNAPQPLYRSMNDSQRPDIHIQQNTNYSVQEHESPHFRMTNSSFNKSQGHQHSISPNSGAVHSQSIQNRDSITSNSLLRNSQAKNDDFNIHPMRRSIGKDEKIKEFEYKPKEKGNKFEQIGKHYQTWKPKRFQQIEIQPDITLDRAQDEMIRKTLVRVKSLLQAQRLKEAENVIEGVINEGHSHSDLYYMAGEVKRSLGLLDEAIHNFLTALKYEVHSPYIYQSLGLCYIDVGEDAKAIPLLKHFVEKIESDSANFELGKALSRVKNYLAASVQLSKAIEINNKHAEYFLSRAEVYEALGFMKLATDDYRAYKNLNPYYNLKLEQEASQCEARGEYVNANTIRSYIKKIISS